VNPEQTIALARIVKAVCPAQAWDEATPDVWVVLLADVSFTDGQAAVLALGRAQRFIAPADIIAEVARVRDRRLDGIDVYRCAFPGNPDDWRAELAWWNTCRGRVADGEAPDVVFDMPVLVTREMPVLEGTFRRPGGRS
jgi:hypothetical protein